MRTTSMTYGASPRFPPADRIVEKKGNLTAGISSYICLSSSNSWLEAIDTSWVQIHPFSCEILRKTGLKVGFFNLFFMSPLCRHLHNHLLSQRYTDVFPNMQLPVFVPELVGTA